MSDTAALDRERLLNSERIANLQAELRDAADEVERLREAASLADSLRGDAHTMGSLAAERDASRTAHAALVAELRAKVAEARTWRGYKTRDIGDAFDATTVTDLLDDLTALLDRHAPTLTTTED